VDSCTASALYRQLARSFREAEGVQTGFHLELVIHFSHRENKFVSAASQKQLTISRSRSHTLPADEEPRGGAKAYRSLPVNDLAFQK